MLFSNALAVIEKVSAILYQTPFLNDTKVLVFFILIPLPISLKEAYHEYHYDIFAA